MSERFYLIAALACIVTPASAQSPESLDLTAVGKDPRWKIAGRTASIADIKGKHALKLSEGHGMGVVWLDGYDFANGVIEVDMLGRSQPVQGSFVGVAFRVADVQTHDAVDVVPAICGTSGAGCSTSATIWQPQAGWWDRPSASLPRLPAV